MLNYDSHNLWFDVNQIRPSARPSPDVAHDGCTYQLRSLILVKPSFSWTSWGFIAEICLSLIAEYIKIVQKLTIRQILFISKYQNDGVTHLPIVNYPMQLRARLIHSIPIRTVHYEYKTLCSRIVVSPERSYLILSTDIPNVELDVLVGDGFHVKAHSGYRCN